MSEQQTKGINIFKEIDFTRKKNRTRILFLFNNLSPAQSELNNLKKQHFNLAFSMNKGFSLALKGKNIPTFKQEDELFAGENITVSN